MTSVRLTKADVACLLPQGSPLLRVVDHGASPIEAVRAPGPSPWHNLILAGYVPDAEDLSLILRAWTKAMRLHLRTHDEDGCPEDWSCVEDGDLYAWIPQFLRWEKQRYTAVWEAGA